MFLLNRAIVPDYPRLFHPISHTEKFGKDCSQSDHSFFAAGHRRDALCCFA